MIPAYPTQARERDRWVLARRRALLAGEPPAARPVPSQSSPSTRLDPWRPWAYFAEAERAASGAVVGVATIFLTNRECPWRCLMCDLWKHTLAETVPPGAIPEQIRFALEQLQRPQAGLAPDGPLAPLAGPEARPALRQVKLYNSGSFFDPHAIPPQDDGAVAALVQNFERVIVECHPALLGERARRFRDLLAGTLEVAMGLETVHPAVLAKLNKRMTLPQFRRAAEFLQKHGMDLRVFVLVQPPFLPEAEGLAWTQRSLDFAFDCGATVVSLIPTRPGNGALEALAAQGQFAPPHLRTLEAALDYGVNLGRGRVFADLWDLERFATCSACFAARRARLQAINLTQASRPPVTCACCPEPASGP